jgi:hypothetical protein
MTSTYILVLGIPYTSAYENNYSFYKEKNIIFIRVYDSNECPTYKRVLIMNILGTIL